MMNTNLLFEGVLLMLLVLDLVLRPIRRMIFSAVSVSRLTSGQIRSGSGTAPKNVVMRSTRDVTS